MRKSIDDGADDHPEGDPDAPPAWWMVALADDCDGCDDIRVVLTVEEKGRAGSGAIAHLSPASARRLRAAVADALKDVGEDPGR